MLDNEFPPLGGGMGTANQALLRKFANDPEIEIELITAALGATAEQETFAPNIHLHKVPVENRNLHHSSNRELISYTLQGLPLAARLQRTRPFDFCFAWSALPAGAMARALEIRFGLPYMVWVSGPDIPGFETRYRRLYPVLTPLLRTIWRHANPLIAKCEQEIEMIHAVAPDVPVTLIPNGVDLSAFAAPPPVPQAGPFKIICVARLIERKGQHHLIRAVKHLTDEGLDVTLDLVGTGDALADYQALAQALGIAERVNFVGYVPREEIPRYYLGAHVFVLPSFNEGMALAALEALAAGLPLVLTRTGGTEELVQEHVNGLTFEWGDVAALTAHLKQLVLDRTLAERMGRLSRSRAIAYSWDRIAARYRQLFAEQIGASAARRGSGRAANEPEMLPISRM